MKKIYILFLLISGIAYPQFGELLKKQPKQPKEKTNLENAWYYLETSPCDFTGIEWLNKELKENPDNKEALSLQKRCYQHKYDNAYEAFKKNNNDTSAISTLSSVMNSYPDFGDEEINYEVAKALLERKSLSKTNEFISRAIMFNPANLDYRWIRVRTNMTSHINKKEFEQAAEDLEFMKENGANTSKVNQNLGLAYIKLGELWEQTYVKENDSYTDDNSSYINQKKANYKKAVQYYDRAIEAYQTASKLDSSIQDDVDYEIKDIRAKIDKITK